MTAEAQLQHVTLQGNKASFQTPSPSVSQLWLMVFMSVNAELVTWNPR